MNIPNDSNAGIYENNQRNNCENGQLMARRPGHVTILAKDAKKESASGRFLKFILLPRVSAHFPIQSRLEHHRSVFQVPDRS